MASGLVGTQGAVQNGINSLANIPAAIQGLQQQQFENGLQTQNQQNAMGYLNIARQNQQSQLGAQQDQAMLQTAANDPQILKLGYSPTQLANAINPNSPLAPGETPVTTPDRMVLISGISKVAKQFSQLPGVIQTPSLQVYSTMNPASSIPPAGASSIPTVVKKGVSPAGLLVQQQPLGQGTGTVPANVIGSVQQGVNKFTNMLGLGNAADVPVASTVPSISVNTYDAAPNDPYAVIKTGLASLRAQSGQKITSDAVDSDFNNFATQGGLGNPTKLSAATQLGLRTLQEENTPQALAILNAYKAQMQQSAAQ